MHTKRLSAAALNTSKLRAKLSRSASPYWISMPDGCSLGYSKTRQGGTWLYRLYRKGASPRWQQIVLGEADDAAPGDGIITLSFRQAVKMGRKCCQHERDRVRAEGHKYTVSDAAKDYLAYFIASGHRTVYDARRIIEFHILPSLGRIPVEELTLGQVRRWVESVIAFRGTGRHYRGGLRVYPHIPLTDEDMRKRKQSANAVLQVLKAMLNRAVREERVSCSTTAWREVRYFVGVRNRPGCDLSAEDQRMLVAACEVEFRQLVMAALYTGARFIELSNSQVGHFLGDALYIPATISKNKRARNIVLEPLARAFFLRHTKGRSREELIFRNKGHKWSQHDQWCRMRSATRRAELDGVKFADLRNIAACNWVNAGMPLAHLAEQLGNSRTICEKHYAHISMDRRSAIVPKLSTHWIDGMENFCTDLA